MACIKAGRATSALIRRDPPKFFATGEQQRTFTALHQKTQIIAPDTRPGAKSSAPHLKSPWRGEEGDGYRHVIAVLNPGWRVIVCKNQIQWILQRRGEQGRWRSRFFFRTRTGLVIPTPSALRNNSRRLDRLNDGVAIVLHAMRNGATLHLEFCETGARWRMSNGRYVNAAVARIVITNKGVVGVGDTLFADATSQTWRFVENI